MIGLDSCPWLSTSVITGRLDKNSFDIADLANIVGSGEAVGGMVNATGAGPGHEATQLQRIVARCSCEFYFASFSSDLDPVAEEHAANIEVSGTVSHDCIAGSVYKSLRWSVFLSSPLTSYGVLMIAGSENFFWPWLNLSITPFHGFLKFWHGPVGENPSSPLQIEPDLVKLPWLRVICWKETKLKLREVAKFPRRLYGGEEVYVPHYVASPQTSFGVRSFVRHACVTNEPQRTYAGRLPTMQTSAKFRDFAKVYLCFFKCIIFKLGKLINFKALFLEMGISALVLIKTWK